ncbi:hypothetical protein DL95DRAFT_402880 [Leptodontidium sp. 2 PMI_412]|nr:hypothetical protein DL95DRAFT_402880 [Leptodontidium sp. 2 PMI_412]
MSTHKNTFARGLSTDSKINVIIGVLAVVVAIVSAMTAWSTWRLSRRRRRLHHDSEEASTPLRSLDAQQDPRLPYEFAVRFGRGFLFQPEFSHRKYPSCLFDMRRNTMPLSQFSKYNS